MFKKLMIITAALTIVSASTAYAGVWEQDAGSWYYINEDGSKATGRISDNGKDYYLAEDGKMLSEGVHLLPDDKIIICNADGSIFYSNSFHREGLDDNMLLKSYQDTYNNWDILQNAYDDLNNRRMVEGGSSFTELSFELSVIAAYRCEDMIAKDYFSHRLNGVFMAEEVAAAYTAGKERYVAENIGQIVSARQVSFSPEEYMLFSNEKYMESPSHYKNIMGERKRVGLAISANGDVSLRNNTQIFGY